MCHFSFIELICITSLTLSLFSSIGLLGECGRLCSHRVDFFLISVSCQSFSKPPILKSVVKHEKETLSMWWCFFFPSCCHPQIILLLAVMKRLARSL